ncbi:helix-turn-helix domain-containing protein [Nocardia brasiliensis]
MELRGSYSNQARLRDRLADLGERVERAARRPPRRAADSTKTSRRRRVSEEEVAQMVARYEAGTSSNQLVADHQLAKGTVLKILRECGVEVRSRGRQPGR